MKRVSIGLCVGMTLVSTLAAAQPLPAQPGEPRCRTTTTTECTGAAAQYAVPYVDPGAPPPVYQQPPQQPYPPPIAAPPPVYQYGPPPQGAPNPYAVPLDLPMLRLGDGLRTVVDQNGQLVVERRTRIGRKGVWATGLAMFLGMPVLTGVGLALDRGADDKSLLAGISFMPIIGMWANAGIVSQTTYYNDCYDYCSSPNNGGRVAGWALAGLVQASGFVMWMVGMGTGPEKIERFPLRFSAGPTANNGMQFGMNGKF